MSLFQEIEMDRAFGKVVVVASLRSSSELNALIQLAKQHCSADEYEELKIAIADASLAISQRIISKIFEKFPDLEQEIEQHYQDFGRPA